MTGDGPQRDGFSRRAVAISAGTRLDIVNVGDERASAEIRAPKNFSWIMPPPRNGKNSLVAEMTDKGARLRISGSEVKVKSDFGPIRPGEMVVLMSDKGANGLMFVYFAGHHVHAVTDAQGRFKLPPLPNGDFEVEVVHGCLGRLRQRVVIDGKHPAALTFSFKVPVKLRANGSRQGKK